MDGVTEIWHSTVSTVGLNLNTVQVEGGGDYVGKIWHDEILKEDNIAADDEDDSDGGNLLDYVKKTANLIENDKKMPVPVKMIETTVMVRILRRTMK